MILKGKKIGFGLTGSHCTYDTVLPQIQNLVDSGAEVFPVISESVKNTISRFGAGKDIVAEIESITKRKVIDTIVGAETFGPINKMDCIVLAPLTGNSLSKLANSVTDTPVLMATKATMRNLNPVVIAISTNDALGLNGVNLMKLMATKNIFFVPFGQDAPVEKPNSLVANLSLMLPTIEQALDRKQIQPVLIGKEAQ